MKSAFIQSFTMAVLAAIPALLQAQTAPGEAGSSPMATNSDNGTPAILLPTAPLAVTNSMGDTLLVGSNGVYVAPDKSGTATVSLRQATGASQ